MLNCMVMMIMFNWEKVNHVFFKSSFANPGGVQRSMGLQRSASALMYLRSSRADLKSLLRNAMVAWASPAKVSTKENTELSCNGQ